MDAMDAAVPNKSAAAKRRSSRRLRRLRAVSAAAAAAPSAGSAAEPSAPSAGSAAGPPAPLTPAEWLDGSASPTVEGLPAVVEESEQQAAFIAERDAAISSLGGGIAQLIVQDIPEWGNWTADDKDELTSRWPGCSSSFRQRNNTGAKLLTIYGPMEDMQSVMAARAPC